MAEFDLVFEGGGAKGLVFVGALQVFEEAGHTPRRMIGTSAGAITAALLAAGYDAAGLRATAGEKTPDGKPRFSSFLDVPAAFDEAERDGSLTFRLFGKVDIPLVPEWMERGVDRQLFSRLMAFEHYRVLFSFIERGGVYAGDAFLEWIEEKIEDRNPGHGNDTFAELFAHTGRDFSVVITDTMAHEMRVLNHRTAPDCPVKWGVRMSMSIPFLWQEVRWKAGWGRHRGQDIAGNAVVDGGALSNFPLDLLTSNHDDVDEIMGMDVDHDGVDNIGFLIDEELEVHGAPPPPKEESEDEDEGPTSLIGRLKTVQRVKRLADTMSGAHDTQVMAEFPDQICRLPAKGYGTTEFAMTEERMTKLIEAGAEATRSYLAGRFG